MIWAFSFGGIVLGAVLWGVPGAIAVGFIGWLAGVIVKSLTVSAAPSLPQRPADAVTARFEALEKRLAALEARLAGVAPAQAPLEVAPSVPVDVAASAPVDVRAAMPALHRVETAPAADAPQPKAAPASETPPPAPPEPAEPNFIVQWFTGGNAIVRVGLVILFIGLAFLIKYGVEHQMIPVELRVAGVAAAGLALLVFGWRLRARRPGYALSLQGAGVAVLYLTIFGAMRLYGLIPPAAAFALLAAISVLSAFLAIAQDSLILAAFGAAGGFMAPILASTGAGSHVMLFSYYLLLNAGIVAIAWFKAWRPLNLLGFAFTALIGLAWGMRSYRPEHFATTEMFLVAFFLVYVAIAVLFARRQVTLLRDYVDGTIVFGTPIFAFGLQAALMRGTEFGLAFSSLAAGAFYVGLAAILHRVGRERWRLLVEAFLALGVVFATLAIPLALDARWTSAAWALEGAAVLWVGVRQDRKLARAFGILLELAAGVAFFHAFPRLTSGPPLVDAPFVGAVLLATAGIWTYRLLARAGHATPFEKALVPFAFLWGLGWWLFAGAHEIGTFVAQPYRLNAIVAFIAATTLAFAIAGMRYEWKEAHWPLLAFAPALFLLALVSFKAQTHPLAYLGWFAWPFALAVHFGLLARVKLREHARWLEFLHAAGVIVVAVLGTIELEWLASEHTGRGTAWSLAARMLVPAILILAISSKAADRRWPVGSHLAAYRVGATLALVVAMGAWSLHVNASHGGRSDPLPYLPLVNALDLAHVLAIFAIVSAWLALRRSSLEVPAAFTGTPAQVVAGALVFVWLNAMLLRTLHHWAGIPYRVDTLARSVLVQASLSVFWTVLALSLMVLATRRATRWLWMLGAALMGVVVVKLLLVDLSHLSGIERIVSFIGVGVLMLVIGYFSPVPPRKTEVSP